MSVDILNCKGLVDFSQLKHWQFIPIQLGSGALIRETLFCVFSRTVNVDIVVMHKCGNLEINLSGREGSLELSCSSLGAPPERLIV
jgi:hypothetical protein